jgi:outer membrane lipoprotein SlyB
MLILALLVWTVYVAGCESKAGTGTLIGAAGGALLGQAIGGNTTGTLIGAAAGAGGGALIGHSMDKSDEKKDKQKAASSASAASDPNTVTVWLTNANGSQTPVKLTRNADGSYTGPKGERYQTMPTEEQLKPVYGI